MTIWRNIIFGCLAIIVTFSIYQDNQIDKELAAVKDRLDNIHKIQIESCYRRYVQDFIDNDFFLKKKSTINRILKFCATLVNK